jgi:hypothetical protein
VARLIGRDAHAARLRRIAGPAMVGNVTRALFASAQDIAVDAAVSITEGSVSGKGHVPSLPGEPPNADTHVLSNSITADSPAPLKAEAYADARYAAAQELGSEVIGLAERPYMRPAAAKNRDKIARRVTDAVNRVIEASGQK